MDQSATNGGGLRSNDLGGPGFSLRGDADHAASRSGDLEHPVEGTISALGIPVKLSDTPGSIRRPAPLLGEHTAEVLREAGFSDAEIAAL